MELEFRDVTKQYGKVKAVNEINCVMGKGVYGLLGVNGAGKTTLMLHVMHNYTTVTWTNITKWQRYMENGGDYREILGLSATRILGYYPDLSVYVI